MFPHIYNSIKAKHNCENGERQTVPESGNRYEWPFHPFNNNGTRRRRRRTPHTENVYTPPTGHHSLGPSKTSFPIQNLQPHIGIQVYDEMSNAISHPIGLAIRCDPPVLWQFLKERKKSLSSARQLWNGECAPPTLYNTLLSLSYILLLSGNGRFLSSSSFRFLFGRFFLLETAQVSVRKCIISHSSFFTIFLLLLRSIPLMIANYHR